MQHAQLQFVEMLMENFTRCGAPPVALQPLEVLRARHGLYPPGWFNVTANMQQVTREALSAKAEVFRLLRKAATWEASTPAAEEMFQAAELCAAEGDTRSAMRLLQLSVQSGNGEHPHLSEGLRQAAQAFAESVREAEEARMLEEGPSSPGSGSSPGSNAGSPARAARGGGGGGGKGGDGLPPTPNSAAVSPRHASASATECGFCTDGSWMPLEDRLLVLLMLLSLEKRRIPQWARTIIELIATGDTEGVRHGLALMIRDKGLVRTNPLGIGARVLVRTDEEDDGWVQGALVARRTPASTGEAAHPFSSAEDPSFETPPSPPHEGHGTSSSSSSSSSSS